MKLATAEAQGSPSPFGTAGRRRTRFRYNYESDPPIGKLLALPRPVFLRSVLPDKAAVQSYAIVSSGRR